MSETTLIRIGDGHLSMAWCRLVPTGIVMQATPTKEQWCALGEGLRVIEHAVQFSVGDWQLLGERYIPDWEAYLGPETGWSESTLGVYKWVAEHVPIENRMGPPLTFSHHQIAASLPMAEQKAWLQKAAEGTDGTPWSVRRMASEIRAASDKRITTRYLVIVDCGTDEIQNKVFADLTMRGLKCKLSNISQLTTVD